MKSIISSQFIKPTASAINLNNLLSSAAVSTLSLGSLMTHSNNYTRSNVNARDVSTVPSRSHSAPAKEITLMHFMRLYKIGNIPVIDFIAVYIMLCILNNLYFHTDYKNVLISAIPFTIIFNILSNHRYKLTNTTLVVLTLSVGYLLWNWLSLNAFKNVN